MAFAPAGPDRAFARVEMTRSADGLELVEARSGIRGFRLLRLGGSAFKGFVRDQYTTLPDIEVIYQIGCRALEQIPSIAQIDLEANNRTWDTIVEQGGALGVYTDSRPPYGCLGLSLRR
jgi:urate oxidase